MSGAGEKPAHDPDTNGGGKVESGDAQIATGDATNLGQPEKQPLRKPTEPSILVFPSKTAKGGKFDCNLISLAHLLDYNENDTKEYVFEVSLFAELFNDMLRRDFGYGIYRALCNNVVKTSEKSKKNDQTKAGIAVDANDTPTVADGVAAIKEEKVEFNPTPDANGRKPNEKMEVEEDEKSKENDSLTKGDESENKKHKLYVKDPFLLMCFAFFDVTFSGYLAEKDLEAILFSLNLYLSRAQVKKMLEPLISKSNLKYRVLTDDYYEGNDESTPTPVVLPKFLYEQYALGNSQNIKELTEGFDAVKPKDEYTISANGSFGSHDHVDVPNLLKRLKTLEDTCLATNAKVSDMNKHTDSLKQKLDKEIVCVKKNEEVIRDLEDKYKNSCKDNEAVKKELDECKKAIRYTLETMKSSSKRLEVFVAPPPPSKELIKETEKNNL